MTFVVLVLVLVMSLEKFLRFVPLCTRRLDDDNVFRLRGKDLAQGVPDGSLKDEWGDVFLEFANEVVVRVELVFACCFLLSSFDNVFVFFEVETAYKISLALFSPLAFSDECEDLSEVLSKH